MRIQFKSSVAERYLFLNMLCFKIFLLCSYFLYRVQTFVVDTHVEYGPEKVFYDLNEAEELFKEFIESFNKEYKNEQEYNYRLEIFKNNLKDINERNRNADEEVYGITEFSDLTPEEFIKDHTGLPDESVLKNDTKLKLVVPVSNVPLSWDWRAKGVVSPVRHQGNCGSCWAFSAVGCVEGQYAKKYGELLVLSDQQMVDCFPKGNCLTGSFPHLAFNAAARMGGYMLGKDYPYQGVEGYCQFQRNKVFVKVRGGQQYLVQNEEQLKTLLYTYGPISIGIYGGSGFSEYRKGIATASSLGCSRYKKANHAVLLVGYGTANGVPYWIIKNSYGTLWGEQGYMRFTRGSNTCNILDYVAVADVV